MAVKLTALLMMLVMTVKAILVMMVLTLLMMVGGISVVMAHMYNPFVTKVY